MGAFPTDIIDKDAYIAELEAEVERLLAETCVLAERLVTLTPIDAHPTATQDDVNAAAARGFGESEGSVR